MVNGEPCVIVDFQHVKPGKGNQFTRTKLKNLLKNSNKEATFRSGEKFEVPDIVYQESTFLYKDESGYHFMNQKNYEQIALHEELIGNKAQFLKESLEVKFCLFNQKIIAVELPSSINLKVVQADPGFKGNTVSNTTKPATLETGLVLQVPLHIKEGDTVKVNTQETSYVERV